MAKIEMMVTWEQETSDEIRNKIMRTLVSLDISDMRKTLLASTMELIYLTGKLDGTREAQERCMAEIKKIGKAVQS